MLNRIASKLTHYTWDLAYFDCKVSNLLDFDFGMLCHIKNPYKKDKWFADPFILDVNVESLQLLVEEFDCSVNRGRIAKLIIDRRSNTIIECKIVLELSTHLSFPAIYRAGDKIFVHPENSASGSSYIYEYDKNSECLINPICVLDEPITDAIIQKNGDKYLLKATSLPDPNGDILRTYESNNLLGPYRYVSEEVFKNNTARMAGAYIIYNNMSVRPAQDCYGAYGKAVIFYDDHTVLSRLAPHGIKYCGIHTYNTFNCIGIVDLKKWDYPLLVAIKDTIKRIIR